MYISGDQFLTAATSASTMVVMKSLSEIEFIFHDEQTNETLVLYGEVDGALFPRGVNISAPGFSLRYVDGAMFLLGVNISAPDPSVRLVAGALFPRQVVSMSVSQVPVLVSLMVLCSWC